MSSIEPGDWFVGKANPNAYLEIIGVTTEDGVDHVDVRVGRVELQISKRYLLANWHHLEEA